MMTSDNILQSSNQRVRQVVFSRARKSWHGSQPRYEHNHRRGRILEKLVGNFARYFWRTLLSGFPVYTSLLDNAIRTIIRLKFSLISLRLCCLLTVVRHALNLWCITKNFLGKYCTRNLDFSLESSRTRLKLAYWDPCFERDQTRFRTIHGNSGPESNLDDAFSRKTEESLTQSQEGLWG